MRYARRALVIGLLLWSIAAIYFSAERHLLTEDWLLTDDPTY